MPATGSESGRAPGTGSIDVEIAGDWSGLEAHADAWDQLADGQGTPSVFWGHAFHRCLWRAFGGQTECRAAIVRRGADVVAILPLGIRRWRAFGLPLRELGFLHNPHVLCSPLLVSPDGTDALSAAFSALMECGGWDTLLLQNVPADTARQVSIAAAARAANLPCDPWRPGRRLYYLPLTGTFEEFLAARSRNFRWQLRKHRRRAEGMGQVRITCHRTSDSIGAALPAVLALERRSWQGARSESAMTERDRAFCCDLAKCLPPEQVGELWLLQIGDQLAAALRMLRMDDVLAVHTMHFDPAFAGAGPGWLLFQSMLQSAWQSGVREVDFHGDTPFYRRWSDSARKMHTLRLYAGSGYGRALQVGRRFLKANEQARPE